MTAIKVLRTAYGREALQALTTVVADAKRADPLAPVTILAPSTAAGIFARRHLAAGVGGRHGIAGLQVVTVDQLAMQIAAPQLTPARMASPAVISSAWRTELSANPGMFAPVADHPATVNALATAHHVLRDLGGSELDAVASAGTLAADVVRLHRLASSKLSQAHFDGTDLLNQAAAMVAAGSIAMDPFGAIALYLPQDLNLAQSRFVRALAAATPMTVIAGLTGVQRADAGVHRTLDRIDAADSTDPSPKPLTAQRVWHASDSDDEVRLVVRAVVEALSRHPGHRIAVLYTAASPYARQLHEQLERADIAAAGPGSIPLAERAVAQGFMGLVRLAGTDLPRADLFRVLAAAPVTDPVAGGRIPLASWERLARDAGVVGGDDWTVRLDRYLNDQHRALADAQATANSDGDVAATHRSVRIQQRLDTATGLQDFVTDLQRTLNRATTLTDWQSLSTCALKLLHRHYPSTVAGSNRHLPAAEQDALIHIEQTLSESAELAAIEQSATIGVLIETLSLALESSTPSAGRIGDGVLVAPLSAAIGLDADEVFVLGLAEDIYPGRAHFDPLLPDEVRACTSGALPRARDALDARQRYLLAAFDAAPSVTASFPRGDLRSSTTRLPSQWLLPTLRELAGDKTLAATDWQSTRIPGVSGAASHAAALLSAPLPATDQDWRTRSVAAGDQLSDPAFNAALALIHARAGDSFTRFDGYLAGASGLPEFDSSAVSPTALETYADCPHAYFVKYLLGVRPIEYPEQTITIGPIDIGLLVHECMDRLVKRCADDLPDYGQPWSAAHRQLMDEIFEAVADEFESNGSTGHRTLWQRERDLVREDITAMLDDDDTWRAHMDAAVVASEMSFGRSGAEPVSVSLPGGGRVLLTGSADKVDRTRDGTVLVTDIKTGSTRRYEAISTEDPTVAGTRLQLPVYAHAALERFGSSATPVRAQYWFVRSDSGRRIELPLDDHVEAAYAMALETLTESITGGLFPAKAPEKADFSWVQCSYCNPDGIGHAAVRRRWERKRNDPMLAALMGLIEPDALVPDEAVNTSTDPRTTDGASS